MKIHKYTEPNMTLCGRSSRGNLVSMKWHNVDCSQCRRTGNQPPRDNEPIESTNTQPELDLELTSKEQ